MTSNTDLKAALDERLEAALNVANYRMSLAIQKSNAKLKYSQSLIYSINGGIFEATPELISFVSTLCNRGKDSAVLLDTKNNPISIDNLTDFLDHLIDRYYEATNELLVEYRAIQKARNTKSLIGA